MNRGHYTNPRVPPAGSPGLLRKAGLSYYMIPRHFFVSPSASNLPVCPARRSVVQPDSCLLIPPGPPRLPSPHFCNSVALFSGTSPPVARWSVWSAGGD